MKKYAYFFLALLALTQMAPLHADDHSSLNDLPYAGLILDKVDLDGIEVSHFKFENDGRVVHVKPNEIFSCSMDYEIDADDLKTMHLNHLVIGLSGHGPQECILHSFGVMDDSGTLTTELQAPEERGAYEVRLSRSRTLTCESAKKDWWKKNSANTVVGYVVVF